MAFEIKNGQGSMFANEQKKNDKEPDFRGQFRDLSGHLYEIAGWKKMTSTNKKIISIKIQEPRTEAKPSQSSPSW